MNLRCLVHFSIGVFVFAMGGFAVGAPVEDDLVGPDVSMDVRALGVAQATVGRARGIDAVLTNPAALAALTDSELAAAATYRRAGLESGFGPMMHDAAMSGFRIAQFGIVHRVRMMRRVGLGFAFNEVRDLDFRSFVEGTETRGDFRGFAIEEERETLGGVYAYTLGAGIEIAPGVRFGLSTDIWDGSRDRAIFFRGTDERRRDSSLDRVVFDDTITRFVSGTRVKAGVELGLVPALSVGGTYIFPADIDIREEWVQRTRLTFDDGTEDTESDRGVTDYTLRLPDELAVGAVLRLDALQLSGALRYVDWTKAEYAPAPARDVARDQFARYYSPATEVRLGAEYRLEDRAAVRAGIRIGSMPLEWKEVTQRPITLTAGFTTPLSHMLLVDVAFLRTTWKREDGGIEESYASNRLVVGARVVF